MPEACYTGYLNGTELAKAYASSDIFVFPSTTDTFGNVIIEAQAAGLPVIVSDVGGPRELVTDGVNGLITKALDVADFTSAIRRLVEDEPLAQRDERRRPPQRGRPELAERLSEILGCDRDYLTSDGWRR